MIINFSETQSLRNEVINFINQLKLNIGPDFKLLDVGGGLNPWLGELVTHVIDIENSSTENLILGDVNDPELWSGIPDNYFDFINCTHVLEDIRDPGFVLKEISRTAKYGFIAVPSRQSENSFIESKFWKGFSHHRWIFRVNSLGILEAFAKFPATSAPNGLRLDSKFFAIPGLKKFLSKFFRKYSAARTKTFSVTELIELGIIWKDRLDFQYFDRDFAGVSTDALICKLNKFVNSEVPSLSQISK